MNRDYIKWIRSKVGNELILLNFVAGYISNEEGDILLQKRKDKNIWGLPGGAIELGESLELAVKREVKEETGIDVSVDKLIGVYSNYFDEYPNGDKAQTITTLFQLNIVGGELSCEDEETIELKYFSLDNIPTLVNKQHNDFIKDIKLRNYGVIR